MAEKTYLLVDGENIDATLGASILARRPHPDERPRWERLLTYCREHWSDDVTGLFFLAVSGELPIGFVQALLAIGYRPVPLSGGPQQKVVDLAIQRTLDALRERPDADVVLLSHDADFAPQMQALADGRRLGLVAFSEFVSGALREVPGLEIVDLERDVQAFNQRLPRVRVIPIDEYDPLEFL